MANTENNRRYRAQHGEHQKEYDRQRYMEHRAEKLAYQKAYYREHREEIRFKKRNGLIR
jgi:hypothetical protein